MPKGYKVVEKQNKITVTNSRKEAREKMERLYPNLKWRGLYVHHRDHNPLNNDLNNLLIVRRCDHKKLHQIDKKIQEYNKLINKSQGGKEMENQNHCLDLGWTSTHEYTEKVCPNCGRDFCWACCGSTNVHEGGKYEPDSMTCPQCGQEWYD